MDELSVGTLDFLNGSLESYSPNLNRECVEVLKQFCFCFQRLRLACSLGVAQQYLSAMKPKKNTRVAPYING